MEEILQLINAMSPFLLLGFFLAGLMHAFVPQNVYSKYLAKDNFMSVFWATLVGVPLPLCSCGVLPTAMSLHKQGASKGATVAFLIATPQTGVDSIIATYSLMGLPFAILRPVVAFITAISGGLVGNLILSKEKDTVGTTATEEEVPKGSCCCHKNEKEEEKQSCCSSKNKAEEKLSFGGKLLKALKYGFFDMMQDIGKYLIIGLVVAGLITVAVPDGFFTTFADNSLISMLLVLAFAVPMYLCATGSIPIAVALMLKGLTPGAALVLLMAGPAINAASMLVVGKVLGKKTLLVYMFSIIIGSMLCGLVIDYVLPQSWFVLPISEINQAVEHSHSWLSFNSICTVVMLILLAVAFTKKYLNKKGHNHGSTCSL